MKIEFNTDNDAFKDACTGEETRASFWSEYTRIIAKINDQIASGQKYNSILDINGNKIGEWSL
jgi:hypothetical protein